MRYMTSDQYEKHKERAREYYYKNKARILKERKDKYSKEKASILYQKSKDNFCLSCGKNIDRRSSYCYKCNPRSHAIGKKYINRKLTEDHKKNIANALKGEKSWHWKGGLSKVNKLRLSSATWRKIRKDCLLRDDNRCQICGDSHNRLEIHHIIPWRISHDDNYKNLLTVCQKCHRRLEKKWMYFLS